MRGACAARLTGEDGPPTFDTGLAEGEAAQLVADGTVQGLFAGLLHNRHELI
jgi:hypothetical protein